MNWRAVALGFVLRGKATFPARNVFMTSKPDGELNHL